MSTKRIEDLEVFKKSHSIALELYRITGGLPDTEKFGLVTQIRRASISINSNLMEGGHRTSSKEFKQFASIARGSTGELKYQVLMLKDLGYLNEQDYSRISSELESISKMLTGLIGSLTEKQSR